MIRMEMRHICMPASTAYTCGITTNNVFNGLLHIYARHRSQLELQIPNLAALHPRLPLKMQDALNGIESAFNMAAAAANIADFIKEFRSSRPARMILYNAQMLVLQYLQSVMCKGPAPFETTNSFGHYQLRYAVTNNEELVVGPTDDLKAPIDAFGDPRPVRLLITAYLD
uniref:Uncharacterized protein n=1 Tax=Panagrellus redivivus TaxID=6233 RepID=A0A7E4ZQL2_PANRE